MEQSQFDLNNSVIDVELQALAKEYAYLYTPIEGIVTRADVAQAGVNIVPSQAQYEIVNPGTLYFSAAADQTEVVQLLEGKQGQITFDAYPDNTTSGEIYQISFTPKQGESGTIYEVRVFLDKMIDQYRLGMTGDITFTLRESPDVIAIPQRYIISQDGKQYVEKNVGKERQRVEITVGKEVDGDVEIIRGMQEGDIIHELKK